MPACLCACALGEALHGQSHQPQNGFGSWIRFHHKLVASLSSGFAAPVQGSSAAASQMLHAWEASRPAVGVPCLQVDQFFVQMR